MSIPVNLSTTIQNVVSQIDAFILIGGRSSRLGRDKAFLEIDGRTLAGRAVDVVRAALPGSKIRMVAGSETQFAATAIAADIPFVFDLYPNRGPLGGLHTALAHSEAPWAFVLACDYPFMSSELIGLLAEQISDDCAVIAPRQPDDRIQPLCAYYNVGVCLPTIEVLLSRTGRPAAVHQLIGELKSRIVEFDEYRHIPGVADAFINVNSGSDLDSLNSGA